MINSVEEDLNREWWWLFLCHSTY